MNSLRLRLLAIIGMSLLVLWSLVAVWMFVDLRAQMRSSLDERLAASARMVAALMAQLPTAPGAMKAGAALLIDVVARDGLACEVSLLRGEVTLETVARTASSPGMADVAPGYSTRMFGGKMWRTYVLQQGGIRVATADRIDIREALLRDVALAAGIPFAVALVGSLLLLGSAIGRGLAPIEGIRRQLANRRPDDDAPLARTSVPTELTPLVQTIAHLLQRVRRTIERERRFTDDAAHELRTPLTAIKTHLQVMRLTVDQGCAGTALDSSLAQAGEGVLRMQRTLEQLQMLARLDGLAGLAVALVGGRLGLGRASGVAQVVPQLGAHGALDQRLLERHRGRVDGLAGHRPGNELVNQFVGDLRQRGAPGRNGCILQLRLARHKWSCRSYLCLKHKIQDRLASGGAPKHRRAAAWDFRLSAPSPNFTPARYN